MLCSSLLNESQCTVILICVVLSVCLRVKMICHSFSINTFPSMNQDCKIWVTTGVGRRRTCNSNSNPRNHILNKNIKRRFNQDKICSDAYFHLKFCVLSLSHRLSICILHWRTRGNEVEACHLVPQNHLAERMLLDPER